MASASSAVIPALASAAVGFFVRHIADGFSAFVKADGDHLLIGFDDQFIVASQTTCATCSGQARGRFPAN